MKLAHIPPSLLTHRLPSSSQRHAAFPGGALREHQEVLVADSGEPRILHPQQALQSPLHHSGAHIHLYHVYQQHAGVSGRYRELERLTKPNKITFTQMSYNLERLCSLCK